MKFYRIYIEITNVCGLSCSFCPTKSLPNKEMSLDFFEKIIIQAKSYTKEVALHIVGDPLTKSNLREYLDIVEKYKLKAMLTTSGYFLKKHSLETLFHPCIKQINISLNSFNKNDTSITFEQYLKPILHLCSQKIALKKEIFINLRVWNLDEIMSERAFNSSLFETLATHFNSTLDIDDIYQHKVKSIRLAPKVILHFDNYFEWPSLKNQNYGDGKCLGLDSHIGILASGKVVPCCLDCDGVIELGDLHDTTLKDILNKPKTLNIINGFKNHKAVEELCQKCSFKDRFN